jgi:hypothetical protein
MIAPLQVAGSETGAENRALQKARQAVGAALLSAESEHPPQPRKVPAWAAWLFAAWVLAATLYYFACMFGLR